ncbi:hypothetical protein RvY_15408 [Ramazzottius varieornatus]|uniref:Uncharacterized protein n=1 Tax=Ramazzottius varieornatus TaxID=947166 RepID=A0A1D1VUT3_RAMVA|nr:hypothetical protein RvY_15408 [Ramazzottius varieornatus]
MEQTVQTRDPAVPVARSASKWKLFLWNRAPVDCVATAKYPASPGNH